MPVRAIHTSTGINVGIASPYSRMQMLPEAARPKERTKAIEIPVTRYQRPPKIAPMISEAAEAKAFIKMLPGKNLREKLN